MKKICLLLFLLLPALSVFAQIDKEFWFVGPEASSSHCDTNVFIRVSTMEDTAHINLRMPANQSFSPVTATINPNSTFSVRLDVIKGNHSWLDSIENRPADQVLRKGFLLTSDHYVTAYYEIGNGANPAIFPMKGKNGLGTNFYIPGQTDYPNHAGNGSEAFDIVATSDTTIITITTTIDIVGHAANVPFQIILHRGQTFSARTLITTASASLAGSHVVSNKPIAITISDDSIVTGGWDIIGDQMVPVDLIGKEYVVIKGFADNNPPSNDDERVYILATQDATGITIDGTAVGLLNTGQQYDHPIPATTNTAYVTATKPVYVYHLSGHPGEAGSSLLPPDSCTGSRKIGFNRSSANAFALLILTRNGNQNFFILNGNSSTIPGSSFNVVPGTNNNWVYYRQNNLTQSQVPLGGNVLENTQGKFHLGILNNVSASSEYGYFSDFSTLYLGADASICPGDSMVLDGGPYRNSYEWKKSAGSNWTTIGTARTYTVTDTGYYACMTNGDFCTLYDTIHISYFPNVTVSLGPDRTICQGTTTTLNPGNGFIFYQWSNDSTTRTITTGNEGPVWVRVTNNNGCKATDTVMILLDSLPQANHSIAGPSTFCQGQTNVAFSVDSLRYATSYAWTLPPGASGASNTRNITLGFSTSAVSGNLKVHGINACGVGPDIVFPLTVTPLPDPAGMITGPDAVCQNQSGVTFSVPAIANATSYQWSLPSGVSIVSGAGTNSIVTDIAANAVAGTVSVTGSSSCGDGASSHHTLAMKLFPVPAGSITGSNTVCQGQTGVAFACPAITGADSYIWTLPPGATITSGSGTNAIVVSFDLTAQPGILTVKGHSNDCGDGTPASLPVTVNPLPAGAAAITGASTVCQAQTGVAYTLPAIANATGYQWALPPGATGSSTTNSISLDFSASATSGNITVLGTNQCGSGPVAVFPVTVNPLPVAAGTITGPSEVCQNQSGVAFSVPAITYATSYFWSLPTGISIASGAGTNSILANVAVNAASGTVTVTGNNSCGNGIQGTHTLSVKLFPVPAGAITGSGTVCQGQTGVSFECPAITGADSYIWTLPSGAAITSGSGTNIVTVSFDSTAQSGSITVKGHSNDCGNGTLSSLAITVNPLPSPAGTITGSSPVCQGQTGIIYSVPVIANATGYSWNVPSGCTILGGSGTNTITAAFGTSAVSGAVSVQGTNATCGNGRKSSKQLTVNPLPLSTGNISGMNPVCQGSSSVPYTVQVADPLTNSWTWDLSPSGAGTILGQTSTVNITWDDNFTGSATLQVQGINGCGSGPLSPAYSILINPKPVVSLTECNDAMTTKNAKPVVLKGGLPRGLPGTYSGTGVSQTVPGTYVFDPGSSSVSGSTGGTPYTITYRYTNIYNCYREATKVIRVYPSNAAQACPGTVTDPRDGTTYQTFLAGSGSSARCWMAENLRYGTFISGSQPQQDNCLVEKYCAGDLSAQCSVSGGYYQWDELMAFNSSEGAQGICMPGWHVPTQQEWAGLEAGLLGTGIAGSMLKDFSSTQGFHGLLSGLFYQNNSWMFSSGVLTASMFWSSATASGRPVAFGLNSYNPSVSEYHATPGNSFQVRCVKNQ